MSNGGVPDPEDFFADTRMSFGDHIEDLRTHLKRALLGLVVALFASLGFAHFVLEFINAPVEKALGDYYDRQQQRHRDEYLAKAQENDELKPRTQDLIIPRKALEDIFGQRVRPGEWVIDEDQTVRLPTLVYPKQRLDDWMEMQKKIGPRPTLRTFTIMEAVLVWFKVCLVCALVLASPWIFYQIWSFIAAGLYPNEKRIVNRYVPFSAGLFLAGVALCQFVVMPNTIAALLVFNQWLGVEPELRLNDWLNFALLLPIIFGVCFQTPLAMFTLERVGLMSVETYKQHWRIVLFSIAILYVIISPTPDPMTMILFLLPMYSLYGLGILLCRLSPRQQEEAEETESDDLIEV
jgi:sec-independent protein translocase protein TatC